MINFNSRVSQDYLSSKVKTLTSLEQYYLYFSWRIIDQFSTLLDPQHSATNITRLPKTGKDQRRILL